jgi:hypothetical protein
MRWRSASLSACSALLLALAGCGRSDRGAEQLPVLTSLRLARLAERTAAGMDCGAPLVTAATAAVNRGEVPRALQEMLLSDANRIAATCSRAAASTLADRLRP